MVQHAYLSSKYVNVWMVQHSDRLWAPLSGYRGFVPRG